MGNNSTSNIKTNQPLKVVLFVSRNKDNKELENFKERREVFLSTKTIDELVRISIVLSNKGNMMKFVECIKVSTHEITRKLRKNFLNGYLTKC